MGGGVWGSVANGTGTPAGVPGRKGGWGSVGNGVPDPQLTSAEAELAKLQGHQGGVSGFLDNLGNDATGAIAGLPSGVYNLFKPLGVSAKNIAEYGPLDAWGGKAGAKAMDSAEKQREQFISGIPHQYAQEYGPLFHGDFGKFGHNFYQHPLGPILDGITVATLGAGGAAKAGELASQAGMIDKASTLANIRKAESLSVPSFGTNERIAIKDTATAPLTKYRQILTNRAMNALPSETPMIGSTARAVRAIQRVSGKEGARLDVQARDFNQAFNKLSNPEKAAWHLHARALDPGKYMDYLKGQKDVSPAALKVWSDPQVHAAFGSPSARLQDALAQGRDLSTMLTAHRVAGGMDELTAATSPYRHLRMLNGAEFQDITKEAPALTAARAKVGEISALREQALAKDAEWLSATKNRDLGPLSPTDAQARLDMLDKQYEGFVQKIIPHVSPYGGKLSEAEQLDRNFLNSRAGKGRFRGVRPRETVKQEEWNLADAKIRDLAEQGTHPVYRAAAAIIRERDALRRALNERSLAHLGGEQPGPLPSAPAFAHASVPGPSNPHTNAINYLGNHLEHAQARLSKLEGTTAKTGDVRLVDKPGRDIPTLAKELHAAGREQPFHVKDSPGHLSAIRSRFASRPSGFTEPATTGTKQSRLVLASRGRIHPFDNALGRDFNSYRNEAQAHLLHDELVKHAAILPHGEQIPHGWEELKLHRGQASAPYMQRMAGEFEHELSNPSLLDRLHGYGNLEQPRDIGGQFEGRHRLVVPRQVQRLVQDETQSHASRLAAIRNVPLGAWKALVLGLRPAFFANITIGNSILGTLQMAPGRWGFVSWLHQVMPGFDKVVGGPPLGEAAMKEVFPEQVSGTFGASVMPHGYQGGNRLLRGASRAAQGVMPATIAYENVLRRALAEGWAFATPEISKLITQNGGDVNAALRVAAKSHPQIIDGISRRIDNALGNYRTYNRFERAIKDVVPFYGWNRHVTSSLFRLASERPQLLDALLNTGEQGKAQADKIMAAMGALPAYLDQAVGVHLPSWLGGQTGPGIQTVINPHAWNPFSTIADEGRLLASPFTHAGAASDAFPLAPDVQALIEQMTGKSMMTGAPIKGNAFKDTLLNVAPQETLLLRALGLGPGPKPTSVNQNNLYPQLLRILGLPVENINRANAAKAARPWRTINIPGP